MSIEQKLQEDMKTAMKSGEKNKVMLIRMLLAEIKNATIDNKGQPLSEDKVIGIVDKFSKDVAETLSFLEKAGTNIPEIEKHKEWVEILKTYLPEKMTEDELRQLVTQIVQEHGFSGKKDLKHVMPLIIPKTKGKIDGKIVNQVVQEILN